MRIKKILDQHAQTVLTVVDSQIVWSGFGLKPTVTTL